MFSFNPFNSLVIIWRERERERERGGCLKLDVQGQGGGKILDVARQEGWGVSLQYHFSREFYLTSFTLQF